MFPLILTVLHRDYNRGYLSSLLRTASIRGNIPNPNPLTLKPIPPHNTRDPKAPSKRGGSADVPRTLRAALSRVAINLIFSHLVKKPNKPKKAKDLKLQ